DPRDNKHSVASRIFRRLAEQRRPLITTNFIRAETHGLLVSRTGRDFAIRFLDLVSVGTASIVRVTLEDENRAIEIIRQYSDKAFSLTDATSFAVMERLQIGIAASFDRDF